MGDISEHFNRSEFECKCGCSFDTVDIGLIEALEAVRTYFMKPVTITSGCRCVEHNANEGGSYGSQHIYGKAADFKVKGVEAEKVYDFLSRAYPESHGLGLYSNRCHIDSRAQKARWNG